MSSQMMKCRCGHSWVQSFAGPAPTDVSTICPVCTASSQGTIQQNSPAEMADSAGIDKSPSEDKLQPGQVLAGFEILEELNRGGMGVIYKARQQGLNRLIALKVISPDCLRDAHARLRFQREVQAAALLNHPNIVTVFHTELDGSNPYLAMEFVPGIDLSRLVKRAGPRSVQEACYYVKEAALGLQHVLEQGLVHRDIKPANLMVSPSPLDAQATATPRKFTVKILDMGLARATTSEEAGDDIHSLTQTGVFLGTPDYIAPEQAEDASKADIRSDLYSLGGTLYFLLVGKVPYPGATLMQKLKRQLMGPLPSVLEQRPDIPPDLDALVKKLMARDPAARFQTPAEFVDALASVSLKRTTSGKGAATDPPKPTAPATTSAAPSAASSVRAHPSGVRALSVSTDGKWLLSGGLDETLRLWDMARFRETRCVAGDVGPVEQAALAPGAKWAASCALRLFKSDMVVQLWDLASGAERRRLKGHTDVIHCVAIAPDGRRVAAGSADQTVRIWALDQPGSPSICLKGHTAAVGSVTFLPGGDSLLSGGHDGLVRLWDVKTGAAKGNLAVKVKNVEALAFHGPTKGIAVAGNVLVVRQADSSLVTLTGHAGSILGVAFSADGKFLLSGGSDGTVRLWDVQEGQEVQCFAGHADKVHAVAWSPDQRTAFSGGADGTIRRWPLP